MRIGTFRAADGGYNGQLRTLSLSIEISYQPAWIMTHAPSCGGRWL